MTGNSQKFVPRITQLDANEFDKEIHLLLKNNLMVISEYFEPGFFNNKKAEIELLIKLLVFKYSLLQCNSTFGQQLLNVQYGDVLSGKKAMLFSLFNHFIPYIKAKYGNAAMKWSNGPKLIDKLEIGVKIIQFLNIVVFLKHGIYSNIVDRLLGLRMVPKDKLSRNVGYGYMTRELMWHGFMELFMFALPLINYQYIKRKLYNMFSFKSKELVVCQGVVCKPNVNCAICNESPVYPCRISIYCDHVACYFCIKSNAVDNDYSCPTCYVKSTANESLEFLGH